MLYEELPDLSEFSHSTPEIEQKLELVTEILVKVEKAKREWETAVDALPELICVIDPRGEILRANRTVESWQLGNVTATKGRGLHALIHPGCRSPACPVAMLIVRNCPVKEAVLRYSSFDPFLHKDVEVEIWPITGSLDDTAANRVVLIRDVTTRRQMEERLHQLNDRLQRTNDELRELLRAKDETVQTLSHELRSPLSLIKGFMELLQDGALGPVTDEQKEVLEMLGSRGDELLLLINRLLTLDTISPETLELKPVAINELMAHVHQSWLLAASNKGIAIRLELPPASPVIAADPILLRQALANLLDNAIKYSSSGQPITLGLRELDNEVEIAVIDQGQGIAAGELGRIFSRFYRIRQRNSPQPQGFGLGLSLCQAIIEAHRGALQVESDGQGQGSTFRFRLPLQP